MQTILKIFLGIITIAIVVHFGLEKVDQIREDRAKKEAYEEWKQERKQGVLDTIERHNAVTDWDEDLFYTSEYQEALLENKERPFHILGSLRDIAKAGDTYRLYLEDDPWDPRIIYELKITAEQYKKLQQIDDTSDGAYMDVFSAIVRVEEVSKPLLSIQRDGESEEENQFFKAFAKDLLLLVVTGECLELSETGRIWLPSTFLSD